MHQLESPSSDIPEAPNESIKKSMSLADLQVEVMDFKMSEATPEAIDALFEGFEDDETAQKLKENMLIISRLRRNSSDDALAETLLNFKPNGLFTIAATPVAFDIIFYNTKDWDNFRNKKDKLDIVKHHVFTHGLSKMTNIQLPGNINLQIPFNCYPPSHPPVEFAHESRHSMNKITGRRQGLGEETSKNIEKEQIIENIIDLTENFLLNNLKDELSAFLDQGVSKARLKLWSFRSRYAFGLYNFKGMPKDYWEYMKKEYSLTDGEIKKIKKEVSKRMNVSDITNRSYAAVKLLARKGYSKDWAVSFLCTEDNFMEDWLEAAKACPSSSN